MIFFNYGPPCEILESVCRVGGARFSSLGQSTKYPVENYSEPLKRVFHINVSNDSAVVHPFHICSNCERVLSRAMQSSLHHGGCDPAVDWKSHRSASAVCTDYAAKSKGGCLLKCKHTTSLHGQPANISVTEHILSFCTHNRRHIRDRNGYFSYRYIAESNTIIQSKRRSPKRSRHRYICGRMLRMQADCQRNHCCILL